LPGLCFIVCRGRIFGSFMNKELLHVAGDGVSGFTDIGFLRGPCVVDPFAQARKSGLAVIIVRGVGSAGKKRLKLRRKE
jgi:hypothetical protein